MRVLSWNINGIRAAAKKGLFDWLEGASGDVVGLQETRAEVGQLTPEFIDRPGWWFDMASAKRKGYSGVAMYARRPADEVIQTLGRPRFDDEGRFHLARFGGLWVANVYFPNGNGKERDNSRVPYKLSFYRRIHKLLEPMKKAGAPILVMGDFNTAPEEIDLARPKTNQKTSGFLPEERKEVRRWIKTGWTDTFRESHPDKEGAYTWWSQRFGVRERNVGWRIDLVMASPGAMPYFKEGFILPDVMGSDHCPLGVVLDDAVVDAPVVQAGDFSA